MMAIKVTGLGELQRNLEQASLAITALGGELAAVKFDPNDPDSVERAIADVEAAIDARVTSFRGNSMVERFIEGIKKQYRTRLLDRASDERLKREVASMAATSIDPVIMRQIENAITDLRSSEFQSFGKPLKKLSHLLHSPELEPITAKLYSLVNLNAGVTG